jgi:hypothetical protein
MTIKYTKWPQNISNGRKIDQMVKKYIIFSNLSPSKIYPNLDFWFENKPSGNPEELRVQPISFEKHHVRLSQDYKNTFEIHM